MDIIFFAVLAVFIFFKLREQFGKIDEDQKRDSIRGFIKEKTKFSNPAQDSEFQSQKLISGLVAEDVIAPIDEKSQKILNSLDSNLKADLEMVLQRAKISPAFFLEGAKSAFEIILSSFSIGDLSSLKPLLSEKIYLQFQAAIEDRKSRNEILNTKIISIDEANIISAKMENDFALIVISLKSKQINYLENSQKELIFGNRTEINTVVDNWTFKKDCNSSDPNWILVATS